MIQSYFFAKVKYDNDRHDDNESRVAMKYAMNDNQDQFRSSRMMQEMTYAPYVLHV